MEMKRNVKAILRIEKDSAVEEIVNDVQNEYLAKGVTKNEFAKRVLAGEFEDIFDENIEAFMRKSKLRLLDDDRRQEIARVEMTDFCAEDICYFISDIAKVIGNVSDEYSELFNMLDLAGFNYSADGFMLPNLMYIDDLKVHSESCSDISITFDAIISAAKLHPNTAGTSKVIIACYPESENVRRVMRDRCFMTVGNSNLMLLIVDTDRIAISGYKPCEPPAFM